ncbi:type II toxin-antitoxin system RelE/ParE family toxin [Candidatus Micrarchaeota archaeon]|nr:type II toxin-antitoxin system RelE/ParE family toxin [Candidatus Micrarchaeota archaeon]
MYGLEVSPEAYARFKKMRKKNRWLLEVIGKKVRHIRERPHHFKPLHFPLHNKRRVHIAGSFVLVYEIREKDKTVVIIDFDHHDNVYMK